jgi:hypothetical protein
MAIDSRLLEHIITEATKSKNIIWQKITTHQPIAAIILRYFEMTIPRFSRSGAASELLEEKIAIKYPEIWREISKAMPGRKRKDRIDELIFKETEKVSYWPERFQLDKKVLKEAIHEADMISSGENITIFNPRIAALLRYLSMTTPKFSMSENIASLLKESLKERYPELWEETEKFYLKQF